MVTAVSFGNPAVLLVLNFQADGSMGRGYKAEGCERVGGVEVQGDVTVVVAECAGVSRVFMVGLVVKVYDFEGKEGRWVEEGVRCGLV